jgi:hypothetical protein
MSMLITHFSCGTFPVPISARGEHPPGDARQQFLEFVGARSKCLRISFSIFSSAILPVPKVVTEIEVGSATPMA